MKKPIKVLFKVFNVVITIIAIIFFLMLFNVFTSCKAKHTTTTVIEKDTIYKSEILKVTPKQLNEIFIEDVCDSLGRLKTFDIVSNTGKVKTTLRSHENTLKLEVNVDSIVDSKVNEFKSTYKAKEVEKIITKTKYPKILWYSLILNIMLTAWIFRKRLPINFH